MQLILPAMLKLSRCLSFSFFFSFPFSVSSPFPAQSTKEHHHLTKLSKENCVVLAKGMCYLLAWPPAASSQDLQSPSLVIKFLEVPLLSQSFPIEKMSPEMGQMRVLVKAYHHPSMAKVSSIMLLCSLWLDVGTGDGEH